MDDFRADLHCHTTCSDGTLTPAEIILLAKQNGLSGLSITDHDSITAYPIAIPAAKKAGLELISGVEFSAIHNGVSVHILGYSFALDHAPIHAFCERHQERRLRRNQEIIRRLTANNMPLTEADVEACTFNDPTSSKHTIGRPHIAQAMVKKGYVDTMSNAFKLFLGEDKPYFVKGTSFSVEETIAVIHDAKGFACIAHPHLIKENQIIPQLLNLNFDGLEGYYARLTPVQNDRWVKIANKKNWLITGGSDFHGDIKPLIDLGASWVNNETFAVLQARNRENNGF